MERAQKNGVVIGEPGASYGAGLDGISGNAVADAPGEGVSGDGGFISRYDFNKRRVDSVLPLSDRDVVAVVADDGRASGFPFHSFIARIECIIRRKERNVIAADLISINSLSIARLVCNAPEISIGAEGGQECRIQRVIKSKIFKASARNGCGLAVFVYRKRHHVSIKCIFVFPAGSYQTGLLADFIEVGAFKVLVA